MEFTDKIKALQYKAGIEADGVASSKTWLNIYYLLFNSLPYDLNVSSLIKAIQEKIDVRADGHPWPKTWDALYNLLIEEETVEIDQNLSDHEYNETILQGMTKEMVPFAKELIHIAAANQINIRLVNTVCDDNFQPSVNGSDFGLTFGVGIFERNKNGELICIEDQLRYAEVAKLGESIGLTWAGNKKTFTSLPYFELRPAWAVKMKESEMIEELSRRKGANMSLLAFL